MEELRNVDKQQDRFVFRENVKRIGRVIGYELSKGLSYKTLSINTPLSPHDQQVVEDSVVVITLLRAGLPLHEGILDVFPHAENGFISAYRKHDGDDFTIEMKYVACPSLEGKVLVLNDPMLATGSSMLAAWEVLLQYGKPKKVVIASVIASKEGIENVIHEAPTDFDLWVGAIDPSLNPSKYIVPGLGDAGDLSFGEKLQH